MIKSNNFEFFEFFKIIVNDKNTFISLFDKNILRKSSLFNKFIK
jgi:hypothetical protein